MQTPGLWVLVDRIPKNPQRKVCDGFWPRRGQKQGQEDKGNKEKEKEQWDQGEPPATPAGSASAKPKAGEKVQEICTQLLGTNPEYASAMAEDYSKLAPPPTPPPPLVGQAAQQKLLSDILHAERQMQHWGRQAYDLSIKLGKFNVEVQKWSDAKLAAEVGLEAIRSPPQPLAATRQVDEVEQEFTGEHLPPEQQQQLEALRKTHKAAADAAASALAESRKAMEDFIAKAKPPPPPLLEQVPSDAGIGHGPGKKGTGSGRAAPYAEVTGPGSADTL